MRSPLGFGRYVVAVLLQATASSCSLAADFSIDLTQFTYSYGSTVHTPDFTLPSGFPATYVDPISGWHLTWNALETPVTSGPVGNVWRMTNPQATAAVPEPPRTLSSINGLGCNCTGISPNEWEVTARIANISNATSVGTLYKIQFGGGDFNPAAPNVHVEAQWFTGDFGGVHYDHVLNFETSVSVAGYLWDSSATPLFVTDANPADTVLELHAVVSNAGQTFSTFYRLDNEATWHLAQSHTLPPGTGVLSGFASSHPFISIFNEAVPVPEPNPLALFALGMPLLYWGARRRWTRPAPGSAARS